MALDFLEDVIPLWPTLATESLSREDQKAAIKQLCSLIKSLDLDGDPYFMLQQMMFI